MWLPFIPRKGGGEGAIAYYQDTGIRIEKAPMKLYIRVWYDCKGRPFGKLTRFITKPGDIWKGKLSEYIDSFGLLGHDFSDYFEGLKDMRTIEMLRDNCCPPELLAEMLGKEETPD